MSKLAGDEFKQAVYDLTRLIPCGRVTSYGAIARCIGSAGSARRVGWALNQCFHETPPVPAHRVVNRNGLLIVLLPLDRAPGRPLSAAQQVVCVRALHLD